MYLWQSLLIYFGSLSLTHKLHSRWNCVMLQNAVITGFIQFTLHLVQILNFAIGKSPTHHNWAYFMLYSWSDWESCSSFTNSLPHIDPCIWPKDFELWFISSKSFIPLLYCRLCASWPARVFWYCFASSKVVSWQQFYHIGQLERVFPSQWMLTHFFDNICSVVKWFLVQSAFCHTSWWLIKLS